jgi:GNAT superfamily N-acetyltransferase
MTSVQRRLNPLMRSTSFMPVTHPHVTRPNMLDRIQHIPRAVMSLPCCAAEVEIRALTTDDDAEGMGRLLVEGYQSLPDSPDDPEYYAELADVGTRIERSIVFGAFADGDTLGCVTYVADETSPYAEHMLAGEASFRMLAVASVARGRGVGEALVRRCIDEATSAGRTALFIHSGSWMRGAHRLYDRLGFERRADRDWLIDDPPLHLFGFWRAL